MPRFVFDVKDSEKMALQQMLEPFGKTYTDWFEEKLNDTISMHPNLIDWNMPELAKASDRNDENKIASFFQAAKWEYADADTCFLTHGLHPYPAKFIPHIPANLIRSLSLRGETVLDPFGGSGTTAVEALRLGRKVISIDANPLSTVIGRAKTSRLTEEEKESLDNLTILLLEESRITLDKSEDEVPRIPNINKWFQPNVILELTEIRRLIGKVVTGAALDVALAAFSRIIVKVSNQDSETRYVSRNKNIPNGYCIRIFLDSLKFVLKKISMVADVIKFAEAHFFTADSRNIPDSAITPESVDLVVTSPPYPNSTDYHLYHRFRLFWLNYDPVGLGHIEIGSHLKSQRKKSGMSEYLEDMKLVLCNCHRLLAPGRYAAFVLGDGVYGGEIFDTAGDLAVTAESAGFKIITTTTRKLPENKRSFMYAAQRASEEKILLLRKPDFTKRYFLLPPSYTMYEYEKELARLEFLRFLPRVQYGEFIDIKSSDTEYLKKLTFVSNFKTENGYLYATSQNLLENARKESGRKESKYATHGIHAYKGKFYPQLAKSLINIANVESGSRIFDPFCGSGTTLLEAWLNGYEAIGCDMNPLAVRISKAKLECMEIGASSLLDSIRLIERYITKHGIISPTLEQFPETVHELLIRWFPLPVLYKLNWLLSRIRLFRDRRIVNFYEVILSDCTRDISQQDPADLRIRRRVNELADSDVFGIFLKKLLFLKDKLISFFSIKDNLGEKFMPWHVFLGDNRKPGVFDDNGVLQDSIDAIITSPPYATALPYIDTQRLSLSAILGLTGEECRKLDGLLTGSREISKSDRDKIEHFLFEAQSDLPKPIITQLQNLYLENRKAETGFRRMNMPSLLLRYFTDMREHLLEIKKIIKGGAKAFYVLGDNRTRAGNEWFHIPTSAWIMDIARSVGYDADKILDISVTTENMKHQKNAILKNSILCLTKHS